MRGNMLVLSLSGALGMFARSMVFPYVPLYIMSLGGQPAAARSVARAVAFARGRTQAPFARKLPNVAAFVFSPGLH